MTRLIDADRLIKVIEKAQFEGSGNIMSIINDAPTVKFPFVHVIIKHPRFGECDGWLDKQRNLLFFDFITTEAASKWNWSWEEADND